MSISRRACSDAARARRREIIHEITPTVSGANLGCGPQGKLVKGIGSRPASRVPITRVVPGGKEKEVRDFQIGGFIDLDGDEHAAMTESEMTCTDTSSTCSTWEE